MGEYAFGHKNRKDRFLFQIVKEMHKLDFIVLKKSRQKLQKGLFTCGMEEFV